MKPFIKRLGVVLLVLAGLYIVLSITPTFGRQIPFNQWAWEHNPFHKVRYFMSDSIIEWLNTEKPSIGETVKKLGTDEIADIEYKPGDTVLEYFLKSGLIIGPDYYTLIIFFNGNGSFKDVVISHED